MAEAAPRQNRCRTTCRRDPSPRIPRASDRRRRRHGQPGRAAQRRLDRSRNCALLAQRQARRGRDYDHCSRTDIDVPHSAYRGLQHRWRSNHGGSRHGDDMSRGFNSQLGRGSNAGGLQQTEAAGCPLADLGWRGHDRSRARGPAQSRRPGESSGASGSTGFKAAMLGRAGPFSLMVGRFDGGLGALGRYPDSAAARRVNLFPGGSLHRGRIAAQSRICPVRLVVGEVGIFESTSPQRLVLRPSLGDDQHQGKHDRLPEQRLPKATPGQAGVEEDLPPERPRPEFVGRRNRAQRVGEVQQENAVCRFQFDQQPEAGSALVPAALC